jgi:tellurite methyltransferase
MASSVDSNSRERWNEKYRATPGAWLEPDAFLLSAFSEYVHSIFPRGGQALDLAGGAGRNSIWLARRGWEVTLVDISNVGIEQARHNAGPDASRIHFVVSDLEGFAAAKLAPKLALKNRSAVDAQFDLVIVFFYLDRRIIPEIVKAIRPGGLLIYKTHTSAQANLAGGPKDPAYLLEAGELPRLAEGLHVLHYREEIAAKATAELVARKLNSSGPNASGPFSSEQARS